MSTIAHRFDIWYIDIRYTQACLEALFSSVLVKLSQVIADLSLPSEESGGEIAANHAFNVQDSKILRDLGTDVFWCLVDDGIG